MRRAVLLAALLAACDPSDPAPPLLTVRNNYAHRAIVRVEMSAAALEPGRVLNPAPIAPGGGETYPVAAGCWWFSAWMDSGSGGGSRQCLEPGQRITMNVNP